MTLLSIVVAMDQQRLIGRDGALPWQLPADLKYFRRITMGKPIIMGRRTHESIARVLPGRENIVISRNARYQPASGCRVFPALTAALAALANAAECMVIGGAALYAEALPLAARLYLTQVHARLDGDVYFPAFDFADWVETARVDHHADAAHAYDYSFITLERTR